jgi:hypothetical protein
MGAHDSVHHEGTAVWVADSESAWTKGVVKGFAGDLLVVTTAAGERRVPPAEAPLQNKGDEAVEVRREGCRQQNIAAECM